MTPEETFNKVGSALNDSEAGKLFGKPCYKVGGKAFVCFFQDEMVFKLQGDDHSNALALKGAYLFDPSGKGRAMKEWVQVPFAHQSEWGKLAQVAQEYVGGML